MHWQCDSPVHELSCHGVAARVIGLLFEQGVEANQQKVDEQLLASKTLENMLFAMNHVWISCEGA